MTTVFDPRIRDSQGQPIEQGMLVKFFGYRRRDRHGRAYSRPAWKRGARLDEGADTTGYHFGFVINNLVDPSPFGHRVQVKFFGVDRFEWVRGLDLLVINSKGEE